MGINISAPQSHSGTQASTKWWLYHPLGLWTPLLDSVHLVVSNGEERNVENKGLYARF